MSPEPEDRFVRVDMMGKWQYVGDLLKAIDLAQRTLSAGWRFRCIQEHHLFHSSSP